VFGEWGKRHVLRDAAAAALCIIKIIKPISLLFSSHLSGPVCTSMPRGDIHSSACARPEEGSEATSCGKEE
jgi:hypothetical protein